MNTAILNLEEMTESRNGFAKRAIVLFYGVTGYLAGCIGLFWLISGAAGFAPVGLSEWQAGSVTEALLVNAGLILLFGLQHSIMARRKFKNWLIQFIPEAAERATFMLTTGMVICASLYYWQTLPGVVWAAESSTAYWTLLGVNVIGWSYLLLATFVTNHFELMGLRQVYLYFVNKPYTQIPFTKKFMYRHSRHPMMFGMLVGLWVVPTMSYAHLALATLLTVYIVVGMYFEEKDLIRNFGETYRKYKKEIATFIPYVF